MEALGEPEDVPLVPPERWRRMESVLTRARLLRKAAPWAAAAAVLLAVVWLMPRKPVPAPLPTVTPHPEALYLAPDCCLVPERGARLVQDGGRLRLEAGSVEWINRGWTTVILETPLGMIKGETVEARVSLSSPPMMSWLRDACADEPVLTVEVREGKLTFGDTEIPAGKAATISGTIAWREIPRRHRPVLPWMVRSIAGSPGFLPLEGTTWELEMSPKDVPTSVGLAFPVPGGVRLWHLGQGWTGWKKLRIAVREGWAEGWVEGRLLMSTRRAGRQLQDAPNGPGIYVWGAAEIRGLKTETLP